MNDPLINGSCDPRTHTMCEQGCYILVQGNTVSAMGDFKGIKQGPSTRPLSTVHLINRSDACSFNHPENAPRHQSHDRPDAC